MPDRSEQNFFSWDNIDEIAEFDRHLGFVGEIISKYPQVGEDIRRRLSYIQDKRNDKCLNISVIGEFSTGKSTFINSVIGYDLLTSCSLQGTTAASTVIEYSPEMSLDVEFRDGGRESDIFPSDSEFREAVEKFTVEPDNARRIKTVMIGVPSEALKSGFRLIDTPGTNSTELWHEKITREAISELSDVSVILTDANKILPESFCGFVNDTLGDIIPQCVFVVTKMDLIRERERKRVLDYAEFKIKQTFGSEDPLVLPYVAAEAIGDGESEKSRELLRISAETEQKLLEYTGRYRMISQAKKLISLIDSVYDELTVQMDALAEGSEKELEMLERSKKADLSYFIAEQKQQRTFEFTSCIEPLRQELAAGVMSYASNCSAYIINTAMMRGSKRALEAFAAYELPQMCYDVTLSLINDSRDKYDMIYEGFFDQMELFRMNFEQLFSDMGLLEMDLRNAAYTPVMPNYVNAAAFVSQRGGKQTIIENIRSSVSEYYNDMALIITESMAEYIDKLTEAISIEIDRYLHSYKEAVDEQIAAERERIELVERKIYELRCDRADIGNRRSALNSVRRNLSAVQPV